MLPLASSAITKTAADQASLLIAACIVGPQLIVALLSPTVGQLAETRGRRLVLMLGFFILPVSGVLLAFITEPWLVVAIQVLDGISAACFGVMVPLITSDIAGRSRHLNLCLGFIGFSVGIGATLSTTVAGWTADTLGETAAFLGLAAVGLSALLLVALAMRETRPEPQAEAEDDSRGALASRIPLSGTIPPLPWQTFAPPFSASATRTKRSAGCSSVQRASPMRNTGECSSR